MAITAGTTDGKRPRVQSAARTVRILMAIASSDSGLSAREISEALGLARQVTYHLLHTLTETGMVTRDDRNRYVLGLRVATLAEGFRRQLVPSEHLAPLVREVARATGETSYAAGWWSGEPTTLAVVRGRNPVQANEIPQGYAGDAHARASGKLLLAFADDALRSGYLGSHKLRRLTPNTIVRRAELERELERVRADGYAIDREEFVVGLSCIAVPLDEGNSPFVLCLSAPTERFVASERDYLDAMRRVAETYAAGVDVVEAG